MLMLGLLLTWIHAVNSNVSPYMCVVCVRVCLWGYVRMRAGVCVCVCASVCTVKEKL